MLVDSKTSMIARTSMIIGLTAVGFVAIFALKTSLLFLVAGLLAIGLALVYLVYFKD